MFDDEKNANFKNGTKLFSSAEVTVKTVFHHTAFGAINYMKNKILHTFYIGPKLKYMKKQ